MKKSTMVQATTVLIALLLWNQTPSVAEASELASSASSTCENTTLTENSLGGMSEILNGYYDTILSESGISVNNVTTTIFVDGAKLEARKTPSLQYQNLALCSALGYVNVRQEPTTNSQIVGRLFHLGAATVISESGGWSKVVSGNVEGYISSEFLATGDAALSLAKENYTQYAQATCTTLNVRTGPGEEYNMVSQISMGQQLKILKVMDEWVNVSVNSNSFYVSKSYVDFVFNFKFAKTMDEIKTDINCMVWPLPSDHRIFTYYGYRKPPIAGASSYHKGLDIGGARGSNIVSVLAGRVTAASYSSSSGYYVEVSHGNGVVTRYLHCSKMLVSVGQYVDQGEVIALVGNTGISTGAHLHFSLELYGNNVDPYPYLKSVH